MAEARKKPVRTLRFELSWSAVAGIGVICFCIFLWMFILGVWTGQTLLQPGVQPSAAKKQELARQQQTDNGADGPPAPSKTTPP